jgi:hypothetical protein
MVTSIHLIILKISNMPCCRKFQASDMLYERIVLRGNLYPSFLIVKPRWRFSTVTSIHHCNQDKVKHIATNTKHGTYAAHRCDHQLRAQQRARTVLTLFIWAYQQNQQPSSSVFLSDWLQRRPRSRPAVAIWRKTSCSGLLYVTR